MSQNIFQKIYFCSDNFLFVYIPNIPLQKSKILIGWLSVSDALSLVYFKFLKNSDWRILFDAPLLMISPLIIGILEFFYNTKGRAQM